MKKSKKVLALDTVKPDLEGTLGRIEQRLQALEQKIDSLVGRNSSRPAEARGVSGQVPPPVQTHHQNQPKMEQPPQNRRQEQNGRRDQRERVMFKAVCADCAANCEVPFKPAGGRPIYCKDCFSARKSSRQLKPGPDLQSTPEPSAEVVMAVSDEQRRAAVSLAKKNKPKSAKPPKKSKK